MVLATACAGLAVGCSTTDAGGDDAGRDARASDPAHDAGGALDADTPVRGTLPRDTSPDASPADEVALVMGNTDFAFAMYDQLSAGSSGNFFYSPYSASLALAMAYAGANGATATQMAAALDFALPPSRLNAAFDALDLAIEAPPASATGTGGQPFALAVADSVWADTSLTLQLPFLNVLSTDYGAGMNQVDFRDDPTVAEAAINAWVAKNTADKIDPLLSPNAVTSATRVVLVNAVYFNAAWVDQFQVSATTTGTFTRADGTTVMAPLMSSGSAATAYFSGQNYQAVELVYSGSTTSMVVILPDPDAFAAVQQSLSTALFQATIAGLSSAVPINLTLPRFDIHGGTLSLKASLQKLGMHEAFASSADFTGMVAGGGIAISDIIEQAFVDVDEQGTLAAAATGVIFADAGAEGVGPVPITVDVDRAFFFFIEDLASRTILFVGRENDPTAM